MDSFILKILIGPNTLFGTRISSELDKSLCLHQVSSLLEEADQSKATSTAFDK